MRSNPRSTAQAMKVSVRACAVAVLTILAGAAAGGEATASATAAGAAKITSGMDLSVRPGADFFAYANGGWVKADVIPADRSSDGTWEQLADQNEKRLATLFRHLSASAPASGTEARKVADFYASFLDEQAVEARGSGALKPTLERIGTIRDRKGLASYLGDGLRADVDILNNTNLHTTNLFGLWVAQDLDNPTRYLPFLVQGGLDLPDREYYLSQSAPMMKVRKQYKAHIAAVLKLIGEDDVDAKAASIYALEEHIAQVHSSRADAEDVKKGDNHWDRPKFGTAAPGMDWKTYFASAGLAQQSEFIVWQPAAVAGISKLVASEPVETWKAYLKFHAADHFSPFLPKAFVDEQFAFYGKALRGTPELRVRWKRAVQYTNVVLGDAVGKIYVQRYFSPRAKASIEDLVKHLIAAFAARIDSLEWMTPETRLKAKAKLATLKVGVGYPDHWVDYSALTIVRNDVLGNIERAERFDYRRNVAKLGRPIDRSEWVMEPQTINAVNLPVVNALNFPAAVLQPPFFDPNRPAALNYGAVGAVIGHEISHSFDDQGAMFDATGQLKDWWTAADFAHFHDASALLIAQFDAYRPLPDIHVNGKQTLSENIADVAGLAAAYSAFHLAVKDKEAPVVEGFSADQQFFISFGHAWRGKRREASLREIVVTDGHAPAQFRAQTVRNNPGWYSAFDVKPSDALYLAPEKRVAMW